MAAQPWTTGLFDCCSDCETMCYGMWCTPCLYGENVAKLTGSGCCMPACLYLMCPQFACCFAGPNRTQLRNKYNLDEEPCSDCCVHWLCSRCAVCQEARHLKVNQG
ncbi:hypothetical protein BSKO_08402 [Bryopsis sp. KO-2023]|nr:hypothetical protein BSKO_08402 [Bryopsis sp. KO-2023]